MLISLQSAIWGSAISLYYVITGGENDGLIAMLTGVLVNSMMLSGTYHKHNSKERLSFGILVAFLSGIAFFLGSISGSSLLWTSIMIIAILPFFGLTNPEYPLLSAIFFYYFDAYILGIGMLASGDVAITYGVYFAGGSLLIVLGGVVRLYIRSRHLNIHETLPYVYGKKMFSINKYSLVYTLTLISSVMLSNYIAFHFKLEHGYWLPLTAFLLLRNGYALSKQRTFLRLIGTILGGVLAFVWCILVVNKVILALAMFPLLYLTIVAISRHYGSFTFFLTITVANMINLTTEAGQIVVAQRMCYTLLGVLLVMATLQILKHFTPQIDDKVL